MANVPDIGAHAALTRIACVHLGRGKPPHCFAATEHNQAFVRTSQRVSWMCGQRMPCCTLIPRIYSTVCTVVINNTQSIVDMNNHPVHSCACMRIDRCMIYKGMDGLCAEPRIAMNRRLHAIESE